MNALHWRINILIGSRKHLCAPRRGRHFQMEHMNSAKSRADPDPSSPVWCAPIARFDSLRSILGFKSSCWTSWLLIGKRRRRIKVAFNFVQRQVRKPGVSLPCLHGRTVRPDGPPDGITRPLNYSLTNNKLLDSRGILNLRRYKPSCPGAGLAECWKTPGSHRWRHCLESAHTTRAQRCLSTASISWRQSAVCLALHVTIIQYFKRTYVYRLFYNRTASLLFE